MRPTVPNCSQKGQTVLSVLITKMSQKHSTTKPQVNIINIFGMQPKPTKKER